MNKAQILQKTDTTNYNTPYLITQKLLKRSEQLGLQEDDDLAVVITRYKVPSTPWQYFYVLAYDFEMDELRGFELTDDKRFYTWVAYSVEDLTAIKAQRDRSFTEKTLPFCAKEDGIEYPYFIEWAQ